MSNGQGRFQGWSGGFTRGIFAAFCAAGMALPALGQTGGPAGVAAVQQQFMAPPDDARVMMRWWWFGPGVVKPELEREILAMKAGGIGGFEIQPVYPMALNDTAKGFVNLPYLSDGFLDAVRFANQTAQKNGMRIDMTLASGWPYGGPHVPVDEASARLRVVATAVPAGAGSVALPAMENGETLLAVFAGPGAVKGYDPKQLKPVEVHASGGRMDVAQPGAGVVVFYLCGRTAQQVKRPAVDAEGFVLDHLSRTAVDNHLRIVGDRLMTAFRDGPPYAVFSDSLEVYGADWTPNFLAEFAKRRGYDLTPHLPELASGTDEEAAELRHDWGLTLTELVDENYLTPVDEWAKAHGTRFRSQTYGFPPVSMSSNRLVALPEGEGPQWNRFSFTRWASSASHLYGRPVTSAETWTWLHSPAFAATPLDMKAEADRFFLLGVNQLIGHGWPYTPQGVAEPGWSFYAAAVFNDHNPWWTVMPDVTKYLQRMSYLLRQGEPANDVAVFLPNDDAYTEFRPGRASLSESMGRFVTPELMQQVLGAGHNVDFVDAEAIERVGLKYPLLVLPRVERLSPATLKAIAAYVERGGKVIAVGSKPGLAPGFAHAAEVTAEVKRLSEALFAKPGVVLVAGDTEVRAAVAKAVAPDVAMSGAAGDDVGFLHRRLKDADVYFLANTSNHAVQTSVTFASTRKAMTAWDPFTGKPTALAGGPVAMELAPYDSRVVVVSDAAVGIPVAPTGPVTVLAELSHDWKLSFGDAAGKKPEPASLKDLESWTALPGAEFFSGTATYTKTVRLTAAELGGARSVVLDFGEGTPVAADPEVKSGMRALLDGPIRDAAVVFVNGQRVGSVWHPPYVLDVTAALHAGENEIRVQVANTDMNLLAGQAPPDYKLLNARYGTRFSPINPEAVKAMPSGMLGPVRLMVTK